PSPFRRSSNAGSPRRRAVLPVVRQARSASKDGSPPSAAAPLWVFRPPGVWVVTKPEGRMRGWVVHIAVTGASGNLGTSVLAALDEDPAIEGIIGIARRQPERQPPKVRWVSADVAGDGLVPAV